MPYPSSITSSRRDGSNIHSHPAPPSYTEQPWAARADVSPQQQPLLQPSATTQNYGTVPATWLPNPRTGRKFGILLLCASICISIGYWLQTPLDSSSRQRTRMKWAAEERYHDQSMKKWELWVRNMTLEKDKWIQDERTWLDGLKARNEKRAAWALEQKDHEKWMADMHHLRRRTEADWAVDQKNHAQWMQNMTLLRQRTHAEWDIEQRNHDIWRREVTMVKERWVQEQMEHEDNERREAEERQRKEQRERDAMEWRDFRRDKCVRYKTREYLATLGNVPLGFNAIDECYMKTMHINGRDIAPTRCEDQGYCGRVTAHFEADYNEPGCTPFFSAIHDKGCVGAKRRYDGKLDNIVEWDSWRTVCSTMSASYGNVYLGPGASCSECNNGGCGYWATWLVDDERCH